MQRQFEAGYYNLILIALESSGSKLKFSKRVRLQR